MGEIYRRRDAVRTAKTGRSRSSSSLSYSDIWNVSRERIKKENEREEKGRPSFLLSAVPLRHNSNVMSERRHESLL